MAENYVRLTLLRDKGKNKVGFTSYSNGLSIPCSPAHPCPSGNHVKKIMTLIQCNTNTNSMLPPPQKKKRFVPHVNYGRLKM